SSLRKNARAVNTFLREAKSAASLNHPNIVIIHDTGTQNGDYYIAMEFIDGYTLKEVLKVQHKFPLDQLLPILKQLIDGLDYAHSKNVVHRDLTTNNIMITKQKAIKIMDFGLARVMKELQNEQSIIGGTPSFMSPEQTLGKPIDLRTDIYSLGICIFELTLGELPFQKGDLGYHHLHTTPPTPKRIDPSIPTVLNDVILKCLEKSPDARFQSISEIKEIIESL
ncbi:MAG: serine/threonine protein kinase, partial [Bdellovibrionales bacterium]|nr:serine/threonine protein kinase [Bdellovibrionales bacterium]